MKMFDHLVDADPEQELEPTGSAAANWRGRAADGKDQRSDKEAATDTAAAPVQAASSAACK